MNTDNPISTPNLSLPKGGGAIKSIGETFAANAFAGTGTLSIPIPTSPARGLEPQLSLDYNSGNGNGIFGLGFGLSLPNITRKTDKGIPKYDGTDIFILSNAEDLVPINHTIKEDNWKVITYQPRTEGLFAQIEQWLNPNTHESYWKVITTDNVTSIYGKTENALIANPNDNTQIFSWLIAETTDSKGNKVLYHYKPGDNANEPAAIYSINRDYTSNKYIQSIQYGNYIDNDDKKQYAFEIIFDYGEYDLEHPDNDLGTWASRQDPFSSYRAGFEIRTNRLCHNILIFHHFSGEFNNQRFLVRATHFEYTQTPVITTLNTVQEMGYQRQSDGSYETKCMPPLQFDYSEFHPANQTFKQLTDANNGTLPGPLNSQFMLIDLYGGGIPGILYNDGTTTLYWKPQGNGSFASPVAPLQFPIHRNLPASNQTLADLDGDGQLELVVKEATYGGYYHVQSDQSWTPYQSFVSYPPEINTPHAEIVGLNGDGKADLLIFDEQALRIYPSKGLDGYAHPQRIPQAADFPLTPNEYAKEVLSFADMFGDGLSHRVRIRSGNVECWPDLGYGQFGSKIVLDNAPQFGDSFNAARLFLADIDGTGTTDLVYVHSDRVEVFFNQSGNGFDQSISIPLPEAYSDLDQISFGDVLGNGTSCLIFTKMAPTVRHYYYEFVSPTDDTVPHFTAGVKPYLLTEINNNLGATTRIQYCSSTKFYLEDEQQGKPWATKLPFPVQVVEKVETIDNISKSKLVTSYKYHNGYYDQVEREFRGFAFVEQWDTEDFNAFSQQGLHDKYQGENLNPALHVPPVHIKRWYRTGAYTEADALAQQFAEQRYQGDSQALPVPDCQFAPPILSSDAETIRQAYRALRGQLIQEEIYGLDNQPGLSENPYQITASNYQVNLVQPRGDQKYAVFLVHGLETLQYDYERNPNDPRISHNFTLDVDDYGNVLKSATVSYPRRLPLSTDAENPADAVYPQQKQLQAVANTGSFINHTADFRQIGIQYQSQSFEIGGLDLKGQDYFTFDEIQAQIDEALNNQIPFDQTISNQTLQARLLDWQRHYYWNEAQDAALELGQISARALLHHSETAVFTPALITKAFDDNVTEEMLQQDGEYALNDGYWWNQGLIYSYYLAENQFYRLNQTQNYVATDTDFSSKTVWEYDAYYLTAVKQTDFLSDTVTNVSSVEVDYHTLQPWQITDINNNISQALFDPLGNVIVTTIYGTVKDKRQGDSDISTYIKQTDANFDNVVNNPSKYLQQATTYFYYDLFAWQNDQKPPCAINLVRETHVSDLPESEESRIQIHITYSDGFGREVETKMKAEPGQAFLNLQGLPNLEGFIEERWLVSGRTVYNNKGKPVEQYLPYYTDTPHYEDQTAITASGQLPPPTVTHYDPLLRPIRVDTPKGFAGDTPKGFFSKTTFTPWQQKIYDADDTVKDSPYYKGVEAGDIPVSEDEQDALDKAAKFYDTPEQKVLDNLGRTFLDIQINVNDNDEHIYLKTQYTLDIEGNVLTMTDPRLATPNFTYLYEMQGNVLKTDSVDAGVRQELKNIYGNSIHTWDGRGFHQSIQYDGLQRLTTIHVEGSDAQGLSLNQIVERKVYGETQPDSQNHNLRGQLAINYDQAGIEYFDLYNIQGQILTARRQLRQDYKTEVNWDNIDSVPLEPEVFATHNSFDALNRITTQTTPDGSVHAPQYDQAGLLKSTEVTFAGESQPHSFITNIEYNANGQREFVENGNGVKTEYTYEDTTNRLVKIISTRPDGTKLQNLNYTYDPVGNVTRLRDYTPQTIFCNQQQVKALSDYSYNALYQLLQANGRQHPGLQQHTYKNSFEPIMPFGPNPNDGQKLENYTQTYQYDAGNNLIEINHQATSSSWKEEMPVAADSNRLQGKPYDVNGNLLELDNLQSIQWDYRNNLSQADVILRPDCASDSEYYVYDSNGNRVRKVSECQKSGGSLTEIEEKIYLGNYEIKRIKQVTNSDTTTILDRQSLRVMDDSTNIAIVHHWLKDDNGRETDDVGKRQFRYQLSNLLGSVTVEVDKEANLISYEEYFPYGGTALIAGDNQKDVKLKEYRYSGKEKDNVTGLYYYGARYYAPWMGRWMSTDPAGTVDGLNLYGYVKGNPVTFRDLDGQMQEAKKEFKKIKNAPYLTYFSSDGSSFLPREPLKGNLRDIGNIVDKLIALGDTATIPGLAEQAQQYRNKTKPGTKLYPRRHGKPMSKKRRAEEIGGLGIDVGAGLVGSLVNNIPALGTPLAPISGVASALQAHAQGNSKKQALKHGLLATGTNVVQSVIPGYGSVATYIGTATAIAKLGVAANAARTGTQENSYPLETSEEGESVEYNYTDALYTREQALAGLLVLEGGAKLKNEIGYQRKKVKDMIQKQEKEHHPGLLYGKPEPEVRRSDVRNNTTAWYPPTYQPDQSTYQYTSTV